MVAKHNLHYQVVLLTSKNYVTQYENFTGPHRIKKLLKFLEYNLVQEDVQEVKITRWNDKGEKE